MKTVADKIDQLRIYMTEENVDAYIITTDDFHGSEYVGEFFRTREYITGFTGSAGICVVTNNEACLWTDGRYFIQAEEQLTGTPVKLMKSGMEGVPSIEEYLYRTFFEVENEKQTTSVNETITESVVEKKNEAKETSVIRVGFDGRTVTAAFVKKLESKLTKKENDNAEKNSGINKEKTSENNTECDYGSRRIEFVYDIDLADKVWDDRPDMSAEPVWRLDDAYAGQSSEDKLAQVRKRMSEIDASLYVISALDEIAWLLNLRGNDVECNPVFLSYMLIDCNKAVLYANEKIFDNDIKNYLNDIGVVIKPYDEIYGDIAKISDEVKDNNTLINGAEKNNIRLLLDENSVNYKIISAIPEKVDIIYKDSPVKLMKAIKNKTECDNIRKAHIKDGVAVTRFIYWLKHNIGGEKIITELDAVNKLEEFRSKSDNYRGISFDTIAAYGAHGAIVHYEPTEETNIPIEPSGLLLVDSGGHYLEGTTDITRTIVVGPVTGEEKKAFTLVLMGHLNLAATHFPYGVRGENLDGIAREPLWRYGMDFNHGTGHGVGYLLIVHEGPQRISYKTSETAPKGAIFEEGMVTSDEPGLYVEGKFGIRHENLVLCVEDNIDEQDTHKENSGGRFMRFETLTFVPFDRDAIDTSYMSDREIGLLNQYHQQVYEKISPYLEAEEKAWLYEVTRPI